MVCGSGGSKNRLAEAAGAEPCGGVRDQKLYAIVERSTFVSEKAKDTSRSDHFWKLRCRKSARRFCAKHMSKSKCQRHLRLRPLLEVELSKSARPRAKHICKPKVLKTDGLGALFEVRMWFCMAGTTDSAPCQS